jgi:DNA-binding Xre family transcriptional regulator
MTNPKNYRVTSDHRRTPEQIERDRAIRAKYAHAPSLEELQKTGDYTSPVSQGEVLQMMQFAARIKARREALHLSLADLSNRCGIDRAALSRLENGQIENPTLGTLERVAHALHQRLTLELVDVLVKD